MPLDNSVVLAVASSSSFLSSLVVASVSALAAGTLPQFGPHADIDAGGAHPSSPPPDFGSFHAGPFLRGNAAAAAATASSVAQQQRSLTSSSSLSGEWRKMDPEDRILSAVSLAVAFLFCWCVMACVCNCLRWACCYGCGSRTGYTEVYENDGYGYGNGSHITRRTVVIRNGNSGGSRPVRNLLWGLCCFECCCRDGRDFDCCVVGAPLACAEVCCP